MNDEAPGLHEESVNLFAQREFLRGQLSKLAEEWETAVNAEGPNLRSLYDDALGCLEVRILELTMGCSRLKREIELVTAALNRGAEVDYDAIVDSLDTEFDQWRAEVEAAARRVEEARKRLSSLEGAEDTAKRQKLYRALAKELHPDIQPGRHPEFQPYWDRLQAAYRGGDLAEMELLWSLLESHTPPDTTTAPDLLEAEVARLRKQCDQIIRRLAELRAKPPFTYASILDDKDLLARRKKEAEDRIAALENNRAALQAHLNKLLDPSD